MPSLPVLHYLWVFPSSCPLNQWCHQNISSSVTLFSFSFNLSQHQSLSQWVSCSQQVASIGSPSIEASTSASVLPMNIQGWFTLRLIVWPPCYLRHSRVFSITTAFFMIQLSHPYMTTDYIIFVGKVMSLLWKQSIETVTDFIFLSSQITEDGDWSHKLKDAYSLEEKLWQT